MFLLLNPCQIIGQNVFPRLFPNNNEYNKEFVFPISDETHTHTLIFIYNAFMCVRARTGARLFSTGRVDLPTFVSRSAGK